MTKSRLQVKIEKIGRFQEENTKLLKTLQLIP